MGDIKDVARALSYRAEEICRYLLPGGRREGSEWCVGSINGEPGNSFKVHLTGDKAGIWGEFNGGGGGDLVELWSMVRRIEKRRALDEARDYLGLQKGKEDIKSVTSSPFNVKAAPYRVPHGKLVREGSPVFEYLNNERKIAPHTIVAFGLEESGRNIIFPFFKDGTRVFNKCLSIDRPNNKKDIRCDAGIVPPLFGWNVFPTNNEYVVLCEGEMDSMSLYQYGIPALSVPMGAQGKKWIDRERGTLSSFKYVYLCFDQDEAGQAATIEVANELGKERCWVVSLPNKDANECWVNGVTREQMQEAFETAVPFIKSPLNKNIVNLGSNIVNLNSQVTPSFNERKYELLTQQHIEWLWKDRVAYGKITLIAGEPGVGKSQLLLYIASIVSRGGTFHFENTPCKPGKVLIFAGEDDPEDTILPRLDAIGATLSNIRSIDGHAAITKNGMPYYKNVSITDDIQLIEKKIKDEGYRLVIFDPISLYLGATDENNNKEVRMALSLLSDIAQRTKTAIILNSHFSKAGSNIKKNAIYRVMGSLGFVAAARVAIAVIKDPEDNSRRLFIPIKSNISQDEVGYVYKVVPTFSSKQVETTKIEWLMEKNSTSASEILNNYGKGDDKKLDEAVELLEQILSKGKVNFSSIRSEFNQNGISMRQLYKAKEKLKIVETVSEKNSNYKVWEFPVAPPVT